MTVEIKRFDIVSVGTFTGAIGAVYGVVMGLPLAGMLVLSAGLMGGQGVELGGSAVVAYIVFIVLVGIISAVGGMISAGIYNLISGAVGGISVETINS